MHKNILRSFEKLKKIVSQVWKPLPSGHASDAMTVHGVVPPSAAWFDVLSTDSDGANTMSTQLCIPPWSLNRVPTVFRPIGEVKAGMSPLPSSR